MIFALAVFFVCATVIACTFLVCKLLAAKAGVPYFDDHPWSPTGPPEWVFKSHKTTTTYAPPTEPTEPKAETEEGP